jgi:hypothetical protein
VSEAVLGSEDSPAKAEAPASVARSSTWETRQIPTSFSASADRIDDTAGMAFVPG